MNLRTVKRITGQAIDSIAAWIKRMSLVKCEGCGAEIDGTVKICPQCGKKRQAYISTTKGFIAVLIAIPVILLIVYVWTMKSLIWFIVAFIVGLVVGCVIGFMIALNDLVTYYVWTELEKGKANKKTAELKKNIEPATPKVPMPEWGYDTLSDFLESLFWDMNPDAPHEFDGSRLHSRSMGYLEHIISCRNSLGYTDDKLKASMIETLSKFYRPIQIFTAREIADVVILGIDGKSEDAKKICDNAVLRFTNACCV